MKIAVTTPTGNVGSKVAHHLVGGNHKIHLIARNPQRVEDLAEKGAIVHQGSLDDGAFLREATKGMQMMFWVTTGDDKAIDVRKSQRILADTAASAIQANRILRVVNLSSMGAQNVDGGGPINGLHDVENRLNQTGAFVTHLRPAYFFENFLGQMSSIQESNSIFLPVSGKTRIPMVGTNDIALVASEILSDDTWTGRPVQEIPGPEDLSFDEAADAISRGIGRAVEHVQVEEVAFREALSGAGMSAVDIDAYCELFRGLESGQLNAVEERTEESATPTTLEEFAHRVMKPLLLEQVASE